MAYLPSSIFADPSFVYVLPNDSSFPVRQGYLTTTDTLAQVLTAGYIPWSVNNSAPTNGDNFVVDNTLLDVMAIDGNATFCVKINNTAQTVTLTSAQMQSAPINYEPTFENVSGFTGSPTASFANYQNTGAGVYKGYVVFQGCTVNSLASPAFMTALPSDSSIIKDTTKISGKCIAQFYNGLTLLNRNEVILTPFFTLGTLRKLTAQFGGLTLGTNKMDAILEYTFSNSI